ncbi:SAM-dependent methyltransferase [Kibdelosporangium phytohabitans]|uniref:Methyltransferase n=1 Tax=Kibdelosporangium phytohabitans TaxID=860235 RepID=A0A0N9HVT9_9PSEU|nr:SAM-dependent methyltransferase [Kibdelosporangium phytohabitans]ALG06249.1 methyltransferase [Kibdelosporangium phytohabitans]MBE1465649.1 hypothetical protein [Kibdelosporangium phytohabitans]
MSSSDEDPYPPQGVDLDHPSIARVYDYLLGGNTNWAIDRQFGDRVLERFPLLRQIARANRLLLHRVVRHLVRRGVRQFIDVGSGVPTMGHTHTTADAVSPEPTAVVYIDNEPVAVAHSEVLLEQHGDPRRHRAIFGDLRDPERLWESVLDTGVIDLDQPVALLMIAVLHVRQPGPDGTDVGPAAVARYRDLLPRGGYLAISHVTDDGVPDHIKNHLTELKDMYDKSGNPVIWRSRTDVEALFGDFERLDPGTTWTAEWHPEESAHDDEPLSFAKPSESVILAGVARKP